MKEQETINAKMKQFSIDRANTVMSSYLEAVKDWINWLRAGKITMEGFKQRLEEMVDEIRHSFELFDTYDYLTKFELERIIKNKITQMKKEMNLI